MKLECGRPCVLATVGTLWILLNAANAASPLNPASNPVYITHVTVIDTRTGTETRDRTVVISGDRIQAVTDSKGVKPPTGAKSVDATGKYVIPGLWDMHAHMLDRWELLGLLYLANGVTGVRDMGTTKPLEEITRVKKEAMNGTVLVPRFVAAGPLLDGWVRWPGYTLVVSSAEEARRVVASLQAEGADFIKVYNSLSREAFFAIAGETKKRGMVFAGHVPYSVSAEEASDAGQKSMEHLVGVLDSCSSEKGAILKTRVEILESVLREGLSPELRKRGASWRDKEVATYNSASCARLGERFVRNKTWQTPTLVQELPYLTSRAPLPDDTRLRYLPREWVEEWRQRWAAVSPEAFSREKQYGETKLQAVRDLHRAGVAMLAGTDASDSFVGDLVGFGIHDEMALLVRAGLTPIEALRAATYNPALYLGREKELGTVEQGKFADLVLLDADPVADIHNTTRISEIFLAGREFDRAALDQVLKDAEVAGANSVK
jgi:hypothetical protein